MKIFQKLLEQLTKEEFREVLRIQLELEEKLENIPCDHGEYSIKIKKPNIVILTDPKGLTDEFIINKFKDEYGFATDSKFLINIGKSILSLDEVVTYCKFDAIVQFLKNCGAKGNLNDFYNEGSGVGYLTHDNILNYMKLHGRTLSHAMTHSVKYYSNLLFDNLSIAISLNHGYDIREKYTIQIEGFN